MAPKSKEEKKMYDKLRRERIKSDPELLRLDKMQRQENYLKRKLEGSVQMISDMSDRSKRSKRKQWKANASAYRQRKKASKDSEDTPIVNTPIAETVPSTPAASRQSSSGRKRLRRDRSAVVRENMKLREQVARLQRKVKRQQKRYERSMVPAASTSNTKSPGKIVSVLMDENDEKEIKKRLLFGEVVSMQLQENTKKIDSRKSKQQIADVIIGDGSRLKKYGLLHQCADLISRRTVDNAVDGHGQPTVILTMIQKKMQQMVIDFLEEDENSKCLPGKKDCITKEGVKKQKRSLQADLIVLHKKFVETTDFEISYATFCRLRPFWIVAPKVTDRDTCLCKRHENFELRLYALHRRGIIRSSKIGVIEEQLCCNPPTLDCYHRKCKSCENNSIEYVGEFDGSQPLIVKQWVTQKVEYIDPKTKKKKTTNKTMKVNIEKPLICHIRDTENCTEKLLEHEGNIVTQYRTIKELKSSLKVGEVLVHCDFSENYATKYHGEIQAVHFGGNRVNISLHTVVAYSKEDELSPVSPKCFCTLSENLDHGPGSIWAHLQPIFDHLKTMSHEITKIHILSDGPSSQYRNKTIFYLVQHRLKMVFPSLTLATWNYHEAGHGKGAPDGVGATIKRTADRLVAQGQDITDVDSLIRALTERLNSVQLFLIDPSAILEMNKSIPHDILPFKGTMSVHQIVWSRLRSQLHMNKLSCSSCMMDCQNHKMGTHTSILGQESEGKWENDEDELLDNDFKTLQEVNSVGNDLAVALPQEQSNPAVAEGRGIAAVLEMDKDPEEPCEQDYTISGKIHDPNLVDPGGLIKTDGHLPIVIASFCTEGLCYRCGGAVSSKRPGVKCDLCCIVAYHDECVQKHLDIPELDIFTCESCSQVLF